MFKRYISCLLGLALLAACSPNYIRNPFKPMPPEPNMHYKVGEPYRIGHELYEPREQPDYDETGVASWYGKDFHEKHTANGDVFNKNALTAAHRTLPLPSMVRVTNQENGRTLILMVNDRGPFAKGRIIDVSERAADILGFRHKGIAKVRVQFLPGQTERLLADLQLQQKASQEHTDIPIPSDELFASDEIAALLETENAAAPSPTPASSPKPQVTVTSTPSQHLKEMFMQAAHAEEPYAPKDPNAPIMLTPKDMASPHTPAQAVRPTQAAQNVPMKKVAEVPGVPPPQEIASLPSTSPQAMQAKPEDIKSAREIIAESPSESQGHYVQIGAYSMLENAARVKVKLDHLGTVDVKEMAAASGNPFYRVRLGPFQDRVTAKTLVEKIMDMGYADAVILYETE